MRGKRSKQYRKLMQQYNLTFGFREPYQVVVDAEMVHDAHRFAMDLAPALARTLHGDVKVMITQCSIRHLFGLPTTTTSSSSDPDPASSSTNPTSFLTTPIPSATKTALLELARTFTLRRCGHHTLPEPLSPLECLSSVVDPKSKGANPHRLVLGVQQPSVRGWARTAVRGVPAIYVKRSVMVMEPMSPLSQGVREGMERGKIVRDDLQQPEGEGAVMPLDEGEGGAQEGQDAQSTQGQGHDQAKRKRKRAKGPNPLSVKKKKAKVKPGVKIGAD